MLIKKECIVVNILIAWPCSFGLHAKYYNKLVFQKTENIVYGLHCKILLRKEMTKLFKIKIILLLPYFVFSFHLFCHLACQPFYLSLIFSLFICVSVSLSVSLYLKLCVRVCMCEYVCSFGVFLIMGPFKKYVRFLGGEGGTQKAYKSVQGEGEGHAGMYVRSQSSKYKIFLLCLTLSFPLTF